MKIVMLSELLGIQCVSIPKVTKNEAKSQVLVVVTLGQFSGTLDFRIILILVFFSMSLLFRQVDKLLTKLGIY